MNVLGFPWASTYVTSCQLISSLLLSIDDDDEACEDFDEEDDWLAEDLGNQAYLGFEKVFVGSLSTGSVFVAGETLDLFFWFLFFLFLFFSLSPSAFTCLQSLSEGLALGFWSYLLFDQGPALWLCPK